MRHRLFYLIILFLISCQKNEEGDKLSLNFTSLKGLVFMTPRNGNAKNIKVEAESYSFKSTVYTDSLGLYRFNNLPFGTYKITLSKDDLGTRYLYGIKINGLDSLYNTSYIEMFKAPNNNIVLSNISLQNEYPLEKTIKFNINYSDSSFVFGFRFFFSNNKYVSISNYQETRLSYCALSTKNYCYAKLPHSFSKVDISKTIYFIGYICNNLDEGYWDYDLKRIVYPTLSKTNTGVLSVNYNETNQQ